MSLNKAMIIGRLGQSPEVRSTQSGTQVATLSIATSERFKDRSGELQEKTQWHRVTCWGRTAEIAGQYLKKGSKIYVEGPIETREYEKDGQKRYSTEIKCLQLTMLDSKGSANNSTGNNSGKPSTGGDLDDGFDDVDPDLPF